MMTVFMLLILWHIRYYNVKNLGEQMEEDFLRENGIAEEERSIEESVS